MNEKHYVGRYLVIGVPGDYQIMEQFGSYRIGRKRYKTVAAATKAAERMQ